MGVSIGGRGNSKVEGPSGMSDSEKEVFSICR